MIDILQIFTTAEAWISLLTLTILEIVLGVDNIIFISIVTGKLKKEQQLSSRRLGLFLALFIRIILLAFISHIVHDMVVPVFYLGGHGLVVVCFFFIKVQLNCMKKSKRESMKQEQNQLKVIGMW